MVADWWVMSEGDMGQTCIVVWVLAKQRIEQPIGKPGLECPSKP